MLFVNACLRLLGWAIALAAVSAVGWWCFESGYSNGLDSARTPNSEAVQIERELMLRGAVRVLDLSPGLWTQVCLFGRGDDWGEAPIPRFGDPPWMFDEKHVTVLLADAAGGTLTMRLPWAEHAPGTPNCVPVDMNTRLVGTKETPWILRLDQE